MKYDLTKKMTLGAKRILDTFSGTMLTLLSEKALDEISVGELCEKATYPRATFYNYFDDKYDLLSYCLTKLTQEISIDDYAQIDYKDRLYVFFDRFYDLAAAQGDLMKKIFSKDINGLLRSSMQIQLNKIVSRLVRDCEHVERYPIPYELVAQHYSNTIMLAVEWCFVRDTNCTKETGLGYLHYLLRDI